MNDEDECEGDQGVCVAPEFSDAVADESSRNAMSNSVIRFGSQSSNEALRTESDFEDYMRRCKKDWTHEEQGELMRSHKTLHELKESWKNTIHAEEVDKSDDEIRECQRGICLGPQKLGRRRTSPGCSCTRCGTQSSRRSKNKR